MKKKIRKGVLFALLGALLLCSCFVSVASETKGSIEITLTDGAEGTSKEGVVFGYRKVADVEDGEYVLLDEYKRSKVQLNRIKSAEELGMAAEKLSEYGNEEGKTVTNHSGVATIRNLEVGVYLLTIVNRAEYDNISPVIVAIPTWNADIEEMLYDVKIIPKHTPIPKIIPTDTPKEELEVVNTGDVTEGWVPVLGIVGGMSLVAFCIWKKRQQGIGDKALHF